MYKKRITKQLDREMLKNWRGKLENGRTSSDFWQLLKKFQKKNSFDPKWMVRHGIAKGFSNLTWNYERRFLPIPTWTEPEDGQRRFKHEPLSVWSQNFYKNPIMMLTNGKRSRYCYSTDGVTWDMIRNINLNSWVFLSQAYNEVLKTGHYHQSMREHKLLAIKKVDPPPDYSKLRPVSVSNNSVNDIEQIHTLRYYKFCEDNHIFNDRQFGFRSSYSIGYLISELRKCIARQKKKYFSVLLTDLSNAFGSSDTEIILSKFVDDLGAQEYKLIKSFLTQSNYRVRYENSYAKIFKGAPRGFTQGSKFSPTGYIREMLGTHDKLTTDAFTFADDAQFAQNKTTIPDLKERSLQSMSEFSEFCEESNIPLNISKCEIMNSTGKNLKLKFNGQKIPHKNAARILGFRLNNHLHHEPQIAHLNGKVQGVRVMIRGFGNYNSEKCQGQMVSGHIIGPFNHANAYDYAWTKDQYCYHQTQINVILQSISSWRAINDARKDKIEDRRIKRAILRMANAANQRFNNGIGTRRINIPIYYLLKRNNQMTIMNVHRMNWQTRGHKILITARPTAEYNDFIQYFIDPVFDENHRIRRRVTDFPYFRPILRRDQNTVKDLIIKTNPTLFIMEFRRTRATFNEVLGHKKALKMAKEFYKSRCQHTEWTGSRCPNCNLPENAWRNDTRNSIRVELNAALEDEPIQEMYLENGEWSVRNILESNVTSNTILVDNFTDLTAVSGHDSLLSNRDLVRLLDTYRGNLQRED